jgi:hypothetical protein
MSCSLEFPKDIVVQAKTTPPQAKRVMPKPVEEKAKKIVLRNKNGAVVAEEKIVEDVVDDDYSYHEEDSVERDVDFAQKILDGFENSGLLDKPDNTIKLKDALGSNKGRATREKRVSVDKKKTAKQILAETKNRKRSADEE